MPLTPTFSSVLAAAVLTLLSACAGRAATAVQAAEPKQACRSETPLGSAVVQRTCRTPMSEQELDAVNRDITLRNQPKPIVSK